MIEFLCLTGIHLLFLVQRNFWISFSKLVFYAKTRYLTSNNLDRCRMQNMLSICKTWLDRFLFKFLLIDQLILKIYESGSIGTH